jgi:hypothetical protein
MAANVFGSTRRGHGASKRPPAELNLKFYRSNYVSVFLGKREALRIAFLVDFRTWPVSAKL